MFAGRIMVWDRGKARVYDRDQLRKNINASNRISNFGPNNGQMRHRETPGGGQSASIATSRNPASRDLAAGGPAKRDDKDWDRTHSARRIATPGAFPHHAVD